MFYVMEPDVDYLEISEMPAAKPACRKCGWRTETGPEVIEMVMTRRSEAMPIILAETRLAFSEYAIRLLREAGITGWRPVAEKTRIRLRGRGRKVKIPTYHEIVVTGRAGHVRQYPGVKLCSDCSLCGHKVYLHDNQGVYVREKLWDGSDIFEIEGMWPTLVTQKVVDLVKARRMRGIEFIPAEEWRDMFLSSLATMERDQAGGRQSD